MRRCLVAIATSVLCFLPVVTYAFPFLNIPFADSCENPSSVIFWKNEAGSLIRYSSGFGASSIGRYESLRGAQPFFNRSADPSLELRTLEMRYDYLYFGENPGTEKMEDKYVFYHNGFHLFQRQFGDELIVDNFQNVKTKIRAPYAYKCTMDSAAANLMTQVYERSLQQQRVVAAKKEEADNVARQERIKEQRRYSEFKRINCRSNARISRTLIEDLGVKLQASPATISINRITLVDWGASWADRFSCVVTIYYPRGVCRADATFNEGGMIVELEGMYC